MVIAAMGASTAFFFLKVSWKKGWGKKKREILPL